MLLTVSGTSNNWTDASQSDNIICNLLENCNKITLPHNQSPFQKQPEKHMHASTLYIHCFIDEKIQYKIIEILHQWNNGNVKHDNYSAHN